MTTPPEETVAGLREAAEKATPGPWKVNETVIHGVRYGGHWVEPTDEEQLIQISGSGGARSYTNRVFDTQDHDDNEANAAFIAAANPQTVLALLDHLAAEKARADAAEAERVSVRLLKRMDSKLDDLSPEEFVGVSNGCGMWVELASVAEIRNAARPMAAAVTPEVRVKTMRLSDGRADYFVSIKVGDREVHPHVFRQEFKAAYHVALYEWLLNGGNEPDLMAFDEGDWPAQVTVHETPTPDAEATISTLTAERDALIRERDEAREAFSFAMPDEDGRLLTLEEAADALIRAMNHERQTVGYRGDLWTVLGECLQARRSALSGAKDERAGSTCPHCKGSRIEYVYGGHGSVREEPCSMCRAVEGG